MEYTHGKILTVGEFKALEEGTIVLVLMWGRNDELMMHEYSPIRKDVENNEYAIGDWGHPLNIKNLDDDDLFDEINLTGTVSYYTMREALLVRNVKIKNILNEI